jgi:uncharacterized membrane protein YedE/YeeE
VKGFVGALLAFAAVALVATLRDLWLTGRRTYGVRTLRSPRSEQCPPTGVFDFKTEAKQQ